MHSDVQDTWANMRMDPVLLKKRNLSMEEGLPVCHFLEYAVRRGTYPAQSVAVVMTHYAQMVCLDYCVRLVGCRWQANLVNLWKTVATLDRFRFWRSHTLTSRAQSQLHLFGRFTDWTIHPTPGVWIDALQAVQWEAGFGNVNDTFELAGVLREAAVVEKIVHGTIYRLAGGGGGALAVEAMEEAQEGT